MQGDNTFTGDHVTFVMQVTITGLCYLVPTKDNRALWVIMPNADDHTDYHEGKVPKHFPAIRFDTGSLGKGTPTKKSDWRQLTPLTKCLQGAASGDIRHLLRRMNGNQSRKHDKHAPLRWFEDRLSEDDEKIIAARAVLTGITDLTPWSGKEWNYGGERIELHTAACCIIQDVPGTALTCDIDGGSIVLKPDPADNTLRVDLCHLPKGELNNQHSHDKPDKGKPPKHWAPYRTLLSVNDFVFPVRPLDDPDIEVKGMNPYACMTVPGCSEDDQNC